MTTLVIVESPAKAKTIGKFLGSGYRVVATYGHIRDLPSKDGSVDTDHGFAMNYEVSPESGKHVDALVKAAREADLLLLATDPDREGEAIAWHVAEVLRQRGKGLDQVAMRRVVFHEITRRAIEEAVAHAREVDMDLVNAQQARRALDYLVGFNLSPLLWKKIRYGLSAGRVQSVALRLVCEREKEIRDFRSREYWSIAARLNKEKRTRGSFVARLAVAEGKKLGKLDIGNGEEALRHRAAIEGQELVVVGVEKKQVSRHPSPPFITSTLQQDASRQLGFSAKKTMQVAQQLYEGMEVAASDGGDAEAAGLITYMRTDSVTLAEVAVAELRALVKERFGREFVPGAPRRYKSSARNAQEAHEAIRPTDPSRTPASVKGSLPRDAFRLYELIWKRTVASQMASARIDQVVVTIAVGAADPEAPYRLRATGSSVVFPGFLDVYSEGRDEVSLQDRDEEEGEAMLPPLEAGERLRSEEVEAKQHFTEPKPRFTEATLVKALESFGIGRPSTYAPIMSTLQDRGYVRLDKRQFHPEDVGEVVNQFLVEHFRHYVDHHFTANLEDELDAVSRGEKSWVPLMESFWRPFQTQVREKETTIDKAKVTSEITEEPCPECGQPLMIKLGRFGRFKACSGYPTCRYTSDLKREGSEQEPVAPVVSDRNCDKCGQSMLVKAGRYGPYLACSAYPSCRNSQPLEPPRDTGVACPTCQTGRLVEKKSRRGKVFYSCSGYPKCKVAYWDRPVDAPCPQCRALFTTIKVTKKKTERVCVTEGCGFREPMAVEETEQEQE